ncbi:DUF2520 domain-containing protein [Marinilabiliaceae bacterium JC017]|nr:DUF2520 domain-containing protein [Marinilabiliaceae bacterium JC017]
MQITLIGSGNVATHLGKALAQAGHTIVQIFSHHVENAITLSHAIGGQPIAALEEITIGAEMYIIAVKDDKLKEVVDRLPLLTGIVVHTAGSVPLETLSRFEQNGILYPFQTFSKQKEVDFTSLPILIESNTPAVLTSLENVAKTISTNVLQASTKQRMQLHLAAVFACNFVNHMYRLSSDILTQANLPFSLLHPLITETTQKILSIPASEAQTGPARRGDVQVIQKHLDSLQQIPDVQMLYKLLSDDIMKKYL